MGFADGMKALGRALKPFGGTLADMAATAVPGGAVAAKLFDAVRNATGSSSDDPDELARAVEQATPEQAAAIRAADQQHELEMTKLTLKRYQADARDRADAREMQTKTKSVTAPILSYIAIGALVSYVFYITWISAQGVEVGNTAENFSYFTVGLLANLAAQAYNFYLGSSEDNGAGGKLSKLLRREK